MSAVNASDNVIEFAAFRAGRLARRPAKPYVLWYPGVGFIVRTNSARQSGDAWRHAHGLQSA